MLNSFLRTHVFMTDESYAFDPEQHVVHHEVLFEQVTTIIKKPVFLGRAFGRRRFLFASIILGMIALTLIGRAAWMQLFTGADYRSRAEANRLRSTPLWPERGVIRDRQGVIVADTIPRFQVTLVPMDVPRLAEDRSLVLGEAARVLGLSVNDLLPIVNATGSARDEQMLVADHLTYEQAMAFAVAIPHLSGFRLDVRSRRRYPLSAEIKSLSHVLGYVGKLSQDDYERKRSAGYYRTDEWGKTGVEKSYESALRGTVGNEVSEVDARGLVQSLVARTQPKNGQDVQLSIDVKLQRVAEKSLASWLVSAHSQRGVVVAMDPRDGSVLAMVSLPSYDNNLFSGGVSSTVYYQLTQDENQPLFPRAWAGTYPSGSTVKIAIAAGALADHLITEQTSFLSVGGIRVGPWFFPDWKPGGHGVTNVRKAIAWSVNTFFYTIGGGYGSFIGMGAERLAWWMERFGLGSKTGLDLPAETTGFVPTPAWKERQKGESWFVGDTYNLSIGQGDLLVTPMQVAVYTATIARGGTPIRPHAVITASSSAETISAIADAASIRLVQDGMRDNVVYGSGRALGQLPFAVSGKTGTAQGSVGKRAHAWFTSYAPAEKPEIVVTVLLEEGGEGSSVAVPVAKDVLTAWWQMRHERGGRF